MTHRARAPHELSLRLGELQLAPLDSFGKPLVFDVDEAAPTSGLLSVALQTLDHTVSCCGTLEARER